MKNKQTKTLALLFGLTLFLSCSKEEFDTNVGPYDLCNPGLYSEQIGEVKWIFSLEPGETKYLKIDGHRYKVCFAEEYVDYVWKNDTYWEPFGYMDLYVDEDLFKFPYDAYVHSGNISDKPIEGISVIYRWAVEACSPDCSKERIDLLLGQRFSINDSLCICNPAYSTITPIDYGPPLAIENYFYSYFIIIKK